MRHFLFLLICGIWGASFLLMKLALAAFGPLSIATARQVAGAATLALLWEFQSRPLPLRRRDLPVLLGIALVGYALPFYIQPYTVRTIDRHTGHGSSFVGMMVSLVPLVTILVSVPMLGVLPRPRQVVGVIGGFAMIVFLFSAELKGGVRLSDLLLASVVPVVYAFTNTVVKRRFADVPASALTLTTLSLGALMVLPLAMTFESVASAPTPELTRAIVSLLVLGSICTGLATFLFYVLIQSEGPLFAGMVSYIIPCVSLVLGALWGESITRYQVLALVGILAMVALVQYGPAEPALAPRPPER